MTKIISFSLWGQDPKYTIGAIRNAELAAEIYPGWTCRFYTGEDVTDEIKSKLLDLKSEVIEMGGADWNGMFWRFFAAENADIMISRDTDSRLGEREKAAVDEWLASDKDFHIMRDHPYHATEILGGMWGARNGILKGIKGMISNYDTGDYDNKHQVDQNFLRELVYPLVKNSSLVHDEFFDRSPFPSNAPTRTGLNFVGNAFTENDKMITDEDFILEKQRREHGV
tara:strand:+ start:485 stop:1162 length:678 start_codon:yes stop_codon:yes gene_type:complete